MEEVNDSPSDGGGGGGGGLSFPINGAANTAAKALSTQAFAGFGNSHCADVFGQVVEGFSAAELAAAGQKANYYEPRKSPDAYYTQNQVTGNGVATNLNDSLPYGYMARTINGPSLSAILLSPDFWTQSSDLQKAIMIHEAFHAYTKWSDDDIFREFSRFGLKWTGKGSEDISDWIKRGCR